MSDHSPNVEQDWLRTISVIVMAGVALAFALKVTGNILIPFIIAVIIVSMVAPIMDFMVIRLRFPHTVAVIACIILVLAFFGGIGYFMVGVIAKSIETAQRYGELIREFAGQVKTFLASYGLVDKDSRIIEGLESRMPALGLQTLSTGLYLLGSMVLLFIFTLFLLSGRNPRRISQGFYAEIDHRIRRYINIKVALSASTGILVGFTLSLIGLESAIVFGVMAFLLNFIPAIGSIIATFVPMPLALAQFVAGQENPNYLAVILVFAIPGAIQMTIGNFLEPKLMGEGFELHPVVVIMALSFWGLLWGPAGMVLAVPITAIFRILLTHFDTTHPIAEILAGNLPQPPAHRVRILEESKKEAPKEDAVSPPVEKPASHTPAQNASGTRRRRRSSKKKRS